MARWWPLRWKGSDHRWRKRVRCHVATASTIKVHLPVEDDEHDLVGILVWGRLGQDVSEHFVRGDVVFVTFERQTKPK